MGSFANTVFSILLGWMQGLISVLWSAFTAGDGESVFQFIGNNWIKIALILCAAGLVADFTVYFFRWAPYKVWKSFFRRLKNRKNGTEEAADEASEEWEKSDADPANYYLPESLRADEPDAGESFRRRSRNGTHDPDDLSRWEVSEKETAEPEPEAEITKAGYTVPMDSPYRRPGSRTGRRRLRVSMLGEDDGDGEIHYYSPRPIVDHREAYHAPVYPEGWKENSGEQDS